MCLALVLVTGDGEVGKKWALPSGNSESGRQSKKAGVPSQDLW